MASNLFLGLHIDKGQLPVGHKGNLEKLKNRYLPNYVLS